MPSFHVARPQSTPEKLHARLGRQRQRLGELGVAHAGRQIDERLGRDLGRLEEAAASASSRVYAVWPGRRLRALDELHVDRHLDLHHVDAVPILRELGHAAGHDLRLLLRELEALLVGAFFVADELEEERDVVGAALVADPLDPRVLLVVDAFGSNGV